MDGSVNNQAKRGISACLIVKNEEDMIEGCLESLQNAVDEIIIIDTGSTDKTKEIASLYDCKIYDFEWNNDFSAPRNFAINKASFNLILSIDADERLLNSDILLKSQDLFGDFTGGVLVELISESKNDKRHNDKHISKLVRLFKNTPEIFFEGIIHEQVLYSIERSGLEIKNSGIKFIHYGYSLTDEQMKIKQERNLIMLNLALEKIIHEKKDNDNMVSENNPGYLYFQRAKTNLALNYLKESEDDFLKALQINPKNGSIYPQTLNYAGIAAFRMGKVDNAIERAKESLSLIPNQSFANFILGESFSSINNFAEAYEAYQRMENAQNSKDIKSMIIGDYYIPQEQIKYRLGKCLLNLKMFDEAHKSFEQGNIINPEDTGNLVGLANIAYHKRDIKSAKVFLNKAMLNDHGNQELTKFMSQVLNYEKSLENAKTNKRTSEINSIKPFLSLFMIVKNEDQFLKDCLDSVADIVDEMIIVDTGSTDRTKDIALQYNAKLFDFEWINDFASARNEALRHCTGEWLLYLDADERISKASTNLILPLLKDSPEKIGAYVVTIESKHLQLNNTTELHRGGYPRLIRNYGYPAIFFKGRVHEQITPSIFALGKSVDYSDIIIEHLGYNKTREEMDKKVRRNYSMLMEHVKEDPLNSYAWYQLGQTLAQLNLFKEAEGAVRMAIQTGQLSDSVYASAAATLSQLTGNQRNFEEALYWSDQSLSKAPMQVYALHLKAYALMYLGNYTESEISFHEVKNRLKNMKGVPRSGFDIVVPVEIIDKGLFELQQKIKNI